ncbi:DUF4097 family beta strand repeat-containing protein [Lihuaxuella thermophila]|uniref:Putative adhesin n=1 Tax=Lihuaxuella thermophila TaxID=1173111 RepID=A0A1H8GR87_9BACL|nr:DUF4097 family beta strand repeat-containing protein [Lihuaxuella thermophila]SEN46007.1 Putative adhesin [Lihuaxuella thermophila]
MRRTMGILFLVCGGLLLITTMAGLGIGPWLFSGTHAKTSSIDHVQEIRIDSPVDVKMIPEDRRDVKAVLQGEESELISLQMSRKQNQLQISLREKWMYWLFHTGKSRLDLYVPRQYNKDVTLEGYGNIQISGSKPRKWTLTGLNVTLQDGNSDIQNLQVHSFDYQHRTGNVRLQEFRSDQASMTVGTGDVNIARFSGALKVKLGTGNLRAQLEHVQDAVTTEVEKGDTWIDLTEEIPFRIHAVTNQGTAECDYPIQGSKTSKQIQGAYKKGTVQLHHQTNKGNIRIH